MYRFCCPAALAVSSSERPSGLIVWLATSTPTGRMLSRWRMSSKTISTGLTGSRRGGAAASRSAAGSRPADQLPAAPPASRSGARPAGEPAPRGTDRGTGPRGRAACAAEIDPYGLALFRTLAGVVRRCRCRRDSRRCCWRRHWAGGDGAALAAGGRHGVDVAEGPRREPDVGHPSVVGRPGDAAAAAREVPGRQHALLLRRQIEEAQFGAVAHERDGLAVGRDAGRRSPWRPASAASRCWP